MQPLTLMTLIDYLLFSETFASGDMAYLQK